MFASTQTDLSKFLYHSIMCINIHEIALHYVWNVRLICLCVCAYAVDEHILGLFKENFIDDEYISWK